MFFGAEWLFLAVLAVVFAGFYLYEERSWRKALEQEIDNVRDGLSHRIFLLEQRPIVCPGPKHYDPPVPYRSYPWYPYSGGWAGTISTEDRTES